MNLRLRLQRPGRRYTGWLIVEPGRPCAFCGPQFDRADALYHALWHGSHR